MRSPSLVHDVSASFPTALRRARADFREDFGLDVAFDNDMAWTSLIESIQLSREDFEKRDARTFARCLDRLKSNADISE